MSQDENHVQTMEELMNKLGSFGRFQLAAFLGYSMDSIIVIFTIVQMVYAGMTPDWYCIVNSTENAWQNISIVDNEEAQTDIDLAINSTFNSTFSVGLPMKQTFRVCSINGRKCEGYEFIGTSRTVVTEWDLVCDMAWVKQIIISIQMAGILFGTAISAQLGEYFGRKKIIYVFLFLCSFVAFASEFSISWQMFAVFKFLAGMSVGVIKTNALPYHIEITSQKWKAFLASFPGNPIGICVFALVAFIFDDWVWIHFANVVIVVPVFLGWFYFPESPRWLAVNDKQDEAGKAVETIAALNMTQIPAGSAALIANIAREEKESGRLRRRYTILDLFSSYQMRKLSIIFCFSCSCINIAFYGIIFEISNLDGNVFLNMFLVAALQIPVQFSITFVANRLGRPGAAFFYFLIAFSGAASCVILSLIPQEVPSRGDIVSGLCILSRISLSTAYNVVVMMSIELYPTAVRGLGYSFVNCSSLIGGILAPFLINFDSMPMASYVIITLLIVACAVSVLVVRETEEVKLPERGVAADDTELSGSDMYLLKGNAYNNNQSINSLQN